MPKIQIPTPLRQYAGKQPAVDVKAGTVGDALSDLVTQHADLRRHLYTDDGKLRAFVNVYLNDEDVRYLQKEATAVKDGDTYCHRAFHCRRALNGRVSYLQQ